MGLAGAAESQRPGARGLGLLSPPPACRIESSRGPGLRAPRCTAKAAFARASWADAPSMPSPAPALLRGQGLPAPLAPSGPPGLGAGNGSLRHTPSSPTLLLSGGCAGPLPPTKQKKKEKKKKDLEKADGVPQTLPVPKASLAWGHLPPGGSQGKGKGRGHWKCIASHLGA